LLYSCFLHDLRMKNLQTKKHSYWIVLPHRISISVLDESDVFKKSVILQLTKRKFQNVSLLSSESFQFCLNYLVIMVVIRPTFCDSYVTIF